MLIKLLRCSNSRIYKEVLISNNHLFLEIIFFLLFELCHFFHHIITRNEHSIKEGRIRECLILPFNFAVEVILAMVRRSIDCSLLHCFCLLLLLDERDFQIIHNRLGRLFWMCIEICLLV